MHSHESNDCYYYGNLYNLSFCTISSHININIKFQLPLVFFYLFSLIHKLIVCSCHREIHANDASLEADCLWCHYLYDAAVRLLLICSKLSVLLHFCVLASSCNWKVYKNCFSSSSLSYIYELCEHFSISIIWF